MSVQWSEEEISFLQENYPTMPTEDVVSNLPNRSRRAVKRKAHRLGLNKCDNYQIIESINSVSKINTDSLDTEFGWFLSGFTAGEGSFVHTEREDRRDRFRYQIMLASVDTDVLYDIKEYLNDIGNIHQYESRDENWDAEVQYSVQKVGALVQVVIPFFEEFSLQNTHKQEQYEVWKQALYEEYDIPEKYQY